MITFDELTEMVNEFRDAARQPEDAPLAAKLLVEEVAELFVASNDFWQEPSQETAEGLLKELVDSLYVTTQYASIVGDTAPEGHVAMALEMLDVVGEAADTVITPGIIDAAVYRVHESNMSKTAAPVWDDNGKLLKGHSYVAPYLDDLSEEIMENYYEKFFDDFSDEDVDWEWDDL